MRRGELATPIAVIGEGPRAVAEPGGGLRLREVEAGDAESLYRWRMEPSTRAMFRRADPIPFAEHRAFVARYLQADCTDHWFVVEVEGRPVGAIALYDFSVDRTAAQWGRFVIAPEHRGNGWGRRALSLLLEHARACGVHRLGCDVLAGNAAAGSLYESLGFVEDGTYDLSGRRFRRLIVIL